MLKNKEKFEKKIEFERHLNLLINIKKLNKTIQDNRNYNRKELLDFRQVCLKGMF